MQNTMPHPLSQALPDFDVVSDRLVSHFGRLSSELTNIVVDRVLSRPYSTTAILSAHLDHQKRQFVFKRIANNPLNASILDGPNRSSVEYSILETIHPKFAAIDRCWVPRPVLVIPELDAFVMEFVEGSDLSDDLKYVHYFANRPRYNVLLNNFHDSGRWLQHFQQITGTRLADAYALENILERCSDRLTLIEESRDPRFASSFRKSASQFIELQVARLANTSILTTGRHGDFGPWNTLATPDGVTVIDFFNYREDPLPVDTMGVLVYLETISHNVANSRLRIRSLREQFLAGLGPLPDVPAPLVLLCEAMQRIRSIAASVLLKSRGGASWSANWEASRSLTAHVRWFRSDHDSSSLWPQ